MADFIRSPKTLVLCMIWICSASMLLSTLPTGSATASATGGNKKPLQYHGGPLLTGNVKLSLLWYGRFGRVQKNTIRSFIKSLNYNGAANQKPQVSTWWHMVESYQSLGKSAKKNPPINIQVVRQTTDVSYSVGKVLIEQEFIPSLVRKAAAGLPPNTLAVILADKQVTVQGLCTGACAVHGVLDKTPYVIVGDPTSECPGACAWPFHQPDDEPKGTVLRPPNGHVGADVMVMNLATGLASVVTNPFKTGFSEGRINKEAEATTQCPKRFGSQASRGNPGKVLFSPNNGGAFNAYGAKRKFLLPAVWDPATKSCWTLM